MLLNLNISVARNGLRTLMFSIAGGQDQEVYVEVDVRQQAAMRSGSDSSYRPSPAINQHHRSSLARALVYFTIFEINSSPLHKLTQAVQEHMLRTQSIMLHTDNSHVRLSLQKGLEEDGQEKVKQRTGERCEPPHKTCQVCEIRES